ncbi:hypothetical protein Golob_013203 [Gossypium lobatum]|uniref:Uncharacterized protein n=1 Tax=Gossypium lobatum TaxID=34289 RepID=A0A7J8LNQ7_9ROSI|nr:hypothetical protein [Gossypium lobatum]
MSENFFPHTVLKVRHKLELKIRALENEWAIFYDMLRGKERLWLGQAYLEDVAEDNVWNSYNHKEAGQFRHCSFPYYDQLTSIYAKDGATRKDVQIAVDIIEDIDVEDITPAKNPKKGSNDHGCKVDVSLDEMDVLATQLHPSKPN